MLNSDIFDRSPVSIAQGIVGTEIFPGGGILLNYTDDDHSQGGYQTWEDFRFRNKDDFPQLEKSDL